MYDYYEEYRLSIGIGASDASGALLVRRNSNVSSARSIATLLIGTGALFLGNGLLQTLLPIRAQLEAFSASAIGLMGAIYFAGFAMTATPGKVGELFKSYLLRTHYGHPVTMTAPIVVIERVTDLIGLFVIVLISYSRLQASSQSSSHDSGLARAMGLNERVGGC